MPPPARAGGGDAEESAPAAQNFRRERVGARRYTATAHALGAVTPKNARLRRRIFRRERVGARRYTATAHALVAELVDALGGGPSGRFRPCRLRRKIRACGAEFSVVKGVGARRYTATAHALVAELVD